MPWKAAMLFAAFGWILLLLADDFAEGAVRLRAGFRAAPPPRRYPAAFFAAAALPPVVLGPLYGMPPSAVVAGAGGGFASGVVAMALNRLAGRWWRLCLCAATMAVLVGWSFLAV